ncbi:hypothetical protein PM10SUCC1_34120 [Propionigenium maris DSM 9537]|uniref:Uncharacterized protein n=1 Tax=Propionigenium maris DSM 9537 TaxID=1123000 RepID=A0A9W6GNN3_9FUSO|nr:hypothetical protein [Propionigenium maris]GLI57898.1 hypothetical protein PM10SUCC1_34120 [Propionigenium maris DSM 9537]
MSIINRIKRRVYIVEHFKNIQENLINEDSIINLEDTRNLLYNYRDVLSGYEFLCYDRMIRKF